MSVSRLLKPFVAAPLIVVAVCACREVPLTKPAVPDVRGSLEVVVGTLRDLVKEAERGIPRERIAHFVERIEALPSSKATFVTFKDVAFAGVAVDRLGLHVQRVDDREAGAYRLWVVHHPVGPRAAPYQRIADRLGEIAEQHRR